eukprot:6182637-Pleurochrysis_carterae.AAC.1
MDTGTHARKYARAWVGEDVAGHGEAVAGERPSYSDQVRGRWLGGPAVRVIHHAHQRNGTGRGCRRGRSSRATGVNRREALKASINRHAAATIPRSNACLATCLRAVLSACPTVKRTA